MFPEVDTHCCVICSKFTVLKTKQGNFLLLLRKDDGKKILWREYRKSHFKILQKANIQNSCFLYTIFMSKFLAS